MNGILSIILIVQFLINVVKSQSCTPQGVRLSLGNYYSHPDQANNTELLQITFHTKNPCDNTYIVIQNATTNDTIKTISQPSESVFNITDNSQGYLQIISITIHTFQVIGPLFFRTKYNYTIYPNATSSDVNKTFNFILPYRDTNPNQQEYNIILTGMMDISSQSAITRQYLSDFAQGLNDTIIDAIIYTGDMAFNLDNNLYQTGITFFADIENITAYIPLMSTPGLRDNANDYQFYTKMISSPDDNLYNDFYYSFNLGYTHFVQINMAYYFYGTNATLQSQLFKWLEQDLTTADLKVNRMVRPWVIVYGYTSFYCSNNSDPFCGTHTGAAAGISSFEDLFDRYNIDLYISASYWPIYERLKPLIKNRANSFGSEIQYDVQFQYMVNPMATIYMIDAAAGNNLFFNSGTDLSNTRESYETGIYSLKADPYQGIGLMTIKSETVIGFKQITTESYSLDNTDNFTLINTLAKYEEDWPRADKITFISSAVVFTIIGGLFLIFFMLNLE